MTTVFEASGFYTIKCVIKDENTFVIDQEHDPHTGKRENLKHFIDYGEGQRIYIKEEALVNVIGEKSYKKAIANINKRIRNIKKTIKLGKETDLYKQMEKEAGFIEHYKTDLTTHDAYNIGDTNPEKGIWLIRKTGTYLVTEATNITEQIMKLHIDNNESEKYFIFENGKLKKVSGDKCWEMFDRLKED